MGLGTDAELDFMLEDSGDEVVYGTQRTFGHLDRGVAEALPGESTFRLLDGAVTLVIRIGSLTNLRRDSAITVAGDSYKIRDVGLPDDEGWQRLTLVEATP